MASKVGTFFIVFFVLIFLGGVAYIFFTHLRARRLGLPPPPLLPSFVSRNSASSSYPSPAASGVLGWINDKIRALRNRRSRTNVGGAYEEPLPARGGGRRGFGPHDPDEAWDARVGNEADGYGAGGYYVEEQELGLHAPAAGTGYHGSHSPGYPEANPYAAPHSGEEDDGYEAPRGRSRSREPERAGKLNPFDEHVAEPSSLSLRGLSPRPAEGAGKGAQGSHEDDERRSIFREDIR